MRKLSTLFMMLLVAAGAYAQSTVTFQVHMDVQEALESFDPTEDLVVVRGSFNGWGGNTHELTDAGDGLYTGAFDFADVAEPTTYEYKFVIVAPDGDAWENVDNRTFEFNNADVTLDAVWFDNVTEVPSLMDIEVRFSVNMEVQALVPENWDPENDMIVIRGSHTALGNWGGAIELNPVTGNPNHYSLTLQMEGVSMASGIEYKFVILNDGNEEDAIWENLDGNRVIIPDNSWTDVDENGFFEHIAPEVYFSNVTFDDVIAQNVALTFVCDAWTVQQWFAENPDEENSGLTSYDDINYIAVCGAWNGWPWGAVPVEYQLQPTTGTLWEATIEFAQGTARNIGYKYGANGADNEAGFEENHSYSIDDSGSTDTVNDVFGYPFDLWYGSLDVDATPVVHAFELKGNYPNPFNPETRIAFTLREAGEVQFKVFDLRGAQVASSESYFMSGENNIRFDGSSLSSGLYLYSVEAQGEVQTGKMMLVK